MVPAMGSANCCCYQKEKGISENPGVYWVFLFTGTGTCDGTSDVPGGRLVLPPPMTNGAPKVTERAEG